MTAVHINAALVRSSTVIVSKAGFRSYCCGTRSYDASTHQCCRGTIVLKSGYHSACCGSRSYDTSTYQCCLGVNIVQRNGFQSYCCGTRTYDSSIDRVALVMLYVGVPASGGFAYQWEHRISVGSCMGLILSLYYMVIHLVSM